MLLPGHDRGTLLLDDANIQMWKELSLQNKPYARHFSRLTGLDRILPNRVRRSTAVSAYA